MTMRITHIVAFVLAGFADGARECSSKGQPISIVTFDEGMGQFALVAEPNGIENRSVRSLSVDMALSKTGFVVSKERQIQRRDLADNQTIYHVRQCPCNYYREDDDRTWFCPVEAPLCSIPRRAENQARCVQIDTASNYARKFWPWLWLWNLIIAVGVMTSHRGRLAMAYPLSLCFPCINRWIAKNIIRRRPQLANEYLRAYHLRNIEQNLQLPVVFPVGFDVRRFLANQSDETSAPQAVPMSLKMKTRVYEGSNDEEVQSNDDEDGLNCTICFAPIEIGDRVGDFPCQHIFHSDCLKVWLTRRAACPLCNRVDVVTPQYNSSTASDTSDNTSASGEVALPVGSRESRELQDAATSLIENDDSTDLTASIRANNSEHAEDNTDMDSHMIR